MYIMYLGIRIKCDVINLMGRQGESNYFFLNSNTILFQILKYQHLKLHAIIYIVK